MATPLLTATLGDELSNEQIGRLSRMPDAMVIAVALDVGGRSLSEIRASALASGAARCHALDVRDDFVRAVVLPSAQCPGAEQRLSTYEALAAAFVADTIRTAADLEQGLAVDLSRAGRWQRAVRPATTPGMATLALTIREGEPVALNQIPMTLSELVDSVETIAGVSAVDVLGAAYAELAGKSDGLIVLRAEGGACAIASETVPA